MGKTTKRKSQRKNKSFKKMHKGGFNFWELFVPSKTTDSTGATGATSGVLPSGASGATSGVLPSGASGATSEATSEILQSGATSGVLPNEEGLREPSPTSGGKRNKRSKKSKRNKSKK